jgi:ureidoacrylate peracid hydrolase
MHIVSLSPPVAHMISLRRGSAKHIYGEIQMAHTAHLVIDLQNGFMEEGAPVEIPTAREIVPNVNAISDEVRRAGGTVIFLRVVTTPESLANWTNWVPFLQSPLNGQSIAEALASGSHYAQLWPGLDVRATDLIVDKTRFGAFVPGASTLHAELQARAIDTLIISGTISNICCESTVREAMQLNYQNLFVSDATAALTDAEHNATLDNVGWMFGDVLTTAELIDIVRTSPTDRQAQHHDGDSISAYR